MANEILEAIARLQSQLLDGFRRVDERFDAMHKNNLAHFEAIYKRFDRLHGESQALEEEIAPPPERSEGSRDT